MKKYITLYIAFLIAICTSSCNDNYVSSIPTYPVNLRLDLTSEYPTFKNSVNQFLMIEKVKYTYDAIGFGGILVCSGVGLDNYGNSLYYAYDLACPHEAKKDIKVYPDKDGLGTVICETCGSKFDVGYGFGNPISGPAKEVLKRYKTNLNGNYLFIFQ